MLAPVHLPILKGSLLTALLIVFVDTMKELPATLIMRPFNFDTLAVQAHRLAADERLDAAAVPSLVIAAIGLLPVILVCRGDRARQQPRRRRGATAQARRSQPTPRARWTGRHVPGQGKPISLKIACACGWFSPRSAQVQGVALEGAERGRDSRRPWRRAPPGTRSSGSAK